MGCAMVGHESLLAVSRGGGSTAALLLVVHFYLFTMRCVESKTHVVLLYYSVLLFLGMKFGKGGGFRG